MEENLIQNIKIWMELDRDIEGLQKKMKELKTKKKTVNENLTKMMKNNNLDCIDVTSGRIRYVKNKVKKGINQKYLLSIMEKYCENKEDAQKICEFIQDNREIKENEKIQFKRDKIPS
jgi:prefoldin subunit 5